MDKEILVEHDGCTFFTDNTYRHKNWKTLDISEWKIEVDVFLVRHASSSKWKICVAQEDTILNINNALADRILLGLS